jgi:hypothetical protein
MNLVRLIRKTNAWLCACGEVNLLALHTYCPVCDRHETDSGCKYIYLEQSHLPGREDRHRLIIQIVESRSSRLKDTIVSGTSVSVAIVADLCVCY